MSKKTPDEEQCQEKELVATIQSLKRNLVTLSNVLGTEECFPHERDGSLLEPLKKLNASVQRCLKSIYTPTSTAIRRHNTAMAVWHLTQYFRKINGPSPKKTIWETEGKTMEEYERAILDWVKLYLPGLKKPIMTAKAEMALKTPGRGEKWAACARVGECLGLSDRRVWDIIKDVHEGPLRLCWAENYQSGLDFYLDGMGLPAAERKNILQRIPWDLEKHPVTYLSVNHPTVWDIATPADSTGTGELDE